ncbi:MAG: type I restriction-modification system subunit M [Candidatus Endonucleobacter bathymodioli]|uniref:site-specific DNA-methyltransferase (adenine-specific) n=1 Tax=Candidatus Endonucleibacter bathymodioli TaxID=539814 RepID=A0AA90ST23_9GAMM|nr:type I restriction-modification system subunit M [Candidatus Endonucleobacter bathymodioli]
MTSTQQFAELKRRIWQIANDVRGTVDGWDFKQYVLGALFYRFISENFARYIEGGDKEINYAKLGDDVITYEIRDDATKTKGYFIYPSQLFSNVVARANNNKDLNTDIKEIFTDIENSDMGYASEEDIKGLFADFDTTSNRLGRTVKDKNSRLTAVLKGVNDLDFGGFEDNEIDLFGDAYEYLIGNYAANAGKSGGEFFTSACFQTHCPARYSRTEEREQGLRPCCRFRLPAPTGKEAHGGPLDRGGFLWSGDQPHDLQPRADEHVPA